MIRLFRLLLISLIPAAAILQAASYTLQLGAFDVSHPAQAKEAAQELIEKAKAAGIETRQVVRRVGSHRYLLVQTEVYPRVADLAEIKKRAKRARLDFFIRPVSDSKRAADKPPAPPKPVKTTSSATKTQHTASTDDLFASNSRFREIIEEGLEIRQRMYMDKERFLESYREHISGAPLEAKLKFERAVGAERDGADVGLLWNIYDGGLFGKKRIQTRTLAKSLAYENDIGKISDTYAKMAQLEIAGIKKNIDYIFTREESGVLQEMLRHYRRRLASGLITRNMYDTLFTRYQQKRKSLDYLAYQTFEKFDSRYRKLVTGIEDVKLLDIKTLQQVALQNLLSRQREELRYVKLSTEERWYDGIRVRGFLDRKQYTFIPRRETLAGIELNVPLSIKHGDSYARAQRTLLKQKHASEKLLLAKEIDALYMDIAYRKSEIEKLKKALHLSQKSLRRIALKRRAPIASERADLYYQQMQQRLALVEDQHRIWSLRADILLDLIQLQYTSGVRIL